MPLSKKSKEENGILSTTHPKGLKILQIPSAIDPDPLDNEYGVELCVVLHIVVRGPQAKIQETVSLTVLP